MIIFRALSVLGLCAVWTVGALAQPPRGPMGGRDGNPPGGPPRSGPMMRSAKGRLPRVVEGAARLDGANALSKKQARRMLVLMSPWKARPRMSEAQAQSLLSGATGVLTGTQMAALDNERPGFGGPRDGQAGRDFGRPGSGGRMSGGGRMGGSGRMSGGFGGGGPRGGAMQVTPAQQNAMRAMMASFNPFYTGSGAQMAVPERMQQGLQRRRDRLSLALSQLQQRAR